MNKKEFNLDREAEKEIKEAEELNREAELVIERARRVFF